MTGRHLRPTGWGALIGALVVAAGLLLGLPGPKAAAAPDATATLTAVADTYLTSRTRTASYGSGPEIRVSHAAYRGLVRFDTSAIPADSTVTSAALRIYSLGTPPSGYVEAHPASNDWSESTTWDDQPTWDTSVVASSSNPPTADSWTSISLPVGEVQGSAVSWGLSYSKSSTIVRLASRENPAHAPQLIITYTTGPGPTPTATATSPSPTATGSAPVIAAAGDIACPPGTTPTNSSCQQAAVSGAILADTAISEVLLLGDNQYESGTLSAYQGSYDPTWGRFKAKTKPVPGNHEYNTAGAAGYYDYFGTLAGDPSKGFYSYDIGSWHVIALNSEKDIAADGAQAAWLKADLAAHANTCTAAYWHKPRWSSGEHGDTASMAPFFQLLYDGGADLLLSGHDHDYERFVALNPSGARDDARGVVQIVSGTGGKSHYAVTGRSTTVTKDNTSFGYTRLTLHATSADISFVSAVGGFTDSTTLTCH